MKGKLLKILVSISFLFFSTSVFAAGKLNLYNWADYTPEDLIEKFEK